MLQSDGAMGQYAHRLAGRLGIAVSDGHRRLLVHAGQELRLRVAAIIDHRFVQAATTGTRIAGNIFEVERLQHIDHEVRAGPADYAIAQRHLGGRACGDFVFTAGCDRAFSLLRHARAQSSRDGRASRCGAFQKRASVDAGIGLITMAHRHPHPDCKPGRRIRRRTPTLRSTLFSSLDDLFP